MGNILLSGKLGTSPVPHMEKTKCGIGRSGVHRLFDDTGTILFSCTRNGSLPDVHQIPLDCHFFDLFTDIFTILHAVPLLVAHPHKKAAFRTFRPGFIMVRELCMKGGFSALRAHQCHPLD